jgi:hypothetical protein
MANLTEYELSRVYGQGWNAAKKLLFEGNLEIDASDAARLNPHSAVQEAERWSEGFKQALQSQARPLNTPGGSRWRPTIRN